MKQQGIEVELTVNGRPARVASHPGRTLLEVLREDLGLTGAKYGCGEGVCGVCTVLLDDLPVRACRVRIGEASGRRVVTIEGLASGGRLHPVQRAFLEENAMQCGFCTPGQIMTVVGLLRLNPRPSREEIIEVMSQNLCRCCTYPRILAAVERAVGLTAREEAAS